MYTPSQLLQFFQLGTRHRLRVHRIGRYTRTKGKPRTRCPFLGQCGHDSLRMLIRTVDAERLKAICSQGLRRRFLCHHISLRFKHVLSNLMKRKGTHGHRSNPRISNDRIGVHCDGHRSLSKVVIQWNKSTCCHRIST